MRLFTAVHPQVYPLELFHVQDNPLPFTLELDILGNEDLDEFQLVGSKDKVQGYTAAIKHGDVGQVYLEDLGMSAVGSKYSKC